MTHLILLLTLACPLHLEVEPLKLVSVAKGSQSEIEEPRTVVVRTATEWAALWKEHAPDSQAPAIDFKQAMLIAVFSGTKPTAAHSVEISQVDARESEIIVTYTETRPGPSDMVAQMLTFPFHIVRTEARAGKVTFKRAAPAR